MRIGEEGTLVLKQLADSLALQNANSFHCELSRDQRPPAQTDRRSFKLTVPSVGARRVQHGDGLSGLDAESMVRFAGAQKGASGSTFGNGVS